MTAAVNALAAPEDMPEDPRDFLAQWVASRGNLRHFFENSAFAPLGDAEQLAAGHAAAAAAAEDIFGLDLDSFSSGVNSVGAVLASGGSLKLTSPDPDIPQEAGVAAFFDVDNTLIQGSSLVVFALGLARRRFFRLREIAPIVWKQLRFRISGNENPADVRAARAQALEFIKGRDVAELEELCEHIVDRQMLDRAYPGTKELAQMHLDAGHQVWLVTATPVQVAQILARRLGFTGALGTVAEVEDGKFTGRLVGDILHGPGKKHAVAALATIEGLDMARCTGYSDSSNDVPMLTMVGTAVAVNPDRTLKRIAEERGWPVRDYRSLRRAVSTYGLPALVAAAFTWRIVRRRRA